MPTLEAFKDCPPFPSNVPIADIPIISYSNLKSDTSYDSNALFEGCREQGFILLDLRGDGQGERLLKVAESMFDLSTELFKLGKETLHKYEADFPRDVNGYKSTGLFRSDGGKFDTMEWYTLNRDEVLSVNSTRQDPDLFAIHRELCQQFFLQAHEVIGDILAHLDKHLDLPLGTLESLMPLEKPSDTGLRLLRAHSPPVLDESHISFNGHCDVGTITMLFNVIGGLQILPGGDENEWLYVRPQPGCAIINIGDSLVEYTGGVLRSSVHRVITPPGQQANAVRQSLAYPVRPAHDGHMKRLSSSIIPPLSEEEQEETRSVDEWAKWKVKKIMNGEFPRTKGGRPILAKVQV